jgi:sulfur carrier protein ThiS
MHITVLPQRKQVEIEGRRRAGEVLRQLGFLPGTAMVIRGEELVPESAMLEADDVVEVRSVISGGAGGARRPAPGARRRGERA